MRKCQIWKRCAGEEEEALLFFYTTWAKAENMDVPPGVPEVPSELPALVAGSSSLVVRQRHGGRMVAQMLGEVHRREEVVGRKPLQPEEILAPGEPWAPWALFKKAWGARLVDLGTGRVAWPADLLTDYANLDCVVELTFLGVEKDWRENGLAGELIKRTYEMAKELGCQGVVMIAGSPITEGMAMRRGWWRWGDTEDKLVAFVKEL